MTNVKIAGVVRHSSVNGPGVRLVIFFQGCPHGCPGCQNPETWDIEGGEERTLESLIGEMKNTRYLDGVTFSGGDPLMQPEALRALAEAAKTMGLTVWCYTGWKFEEILSGAAGGEAQKALESIDVLVDGSFRLEEKTDDAIYRGSRNQRLIDVPRSLADNTVRLASV